MADRTPREDWREHLLNRLRRLVLPVAMLSAAIGVSLSRTDATRWFAGGILAVSLLITVLSSPRFSYATRAWSMLSAVFGIALGAYVFVGLSPGPVLTVAFCLVFAALLLGRKVMTAALLLAGAYVFALAGAIALGLWSGPPQLDVDQRDPLFWVREGSIAVFTWGAVAFSVLFVVNALERTSRRRRLALEEKDEALQRLQSESTARREAEAIAVQSQKLDALGQLAAGVAHDFNNALVVVKLWTEILAASKSQEEVEEALQAIENATDQGEQLARQLLTFARKEVRAPRNLRLDEVVADATRTLGRLLPSTIRMRVDTQSDGACVFADETQLHQLMFNLLINSRDAIDGDGEVVLRTYCVDDADTEDGLGWAVLEVEDDGAGMDEGTQRHALEPFFTTKEPGRGTGLGLSTSFGIVEQSLGRLEVDSAPGSGTRVTISLPRVELAAENRLPEPPRDPRPGHRAARVLVLEDDPLVRAPIVLMLRRCGFEVLDADDGHTAVRLLADADAPIDFLCTDAVFPGASLRQVIDAFEAASPTGRVVICSGYVREGLALRGVEAGLYEFLPKPFAAHELVAKLDSMLPATR